MQIKEVIKFTRGKMDYYVTRKEDLIRCMNDAITSKDCKHYCEQEIVKADENIDYYSSLLEILEGNKNE